MAKILPDGLADLCPVGSSPPGLHANELEEKRESNEHRYRPVEPCCGAIGSLYCKEVQSPPSSYRSPFKTAASFIERPESGCRSSQSGKSATVGKEAPGEERPKSRDGRRGKTRPPSQKEHLPPFAPFTRLSLTDDRLDGIAHLPTGPAAHPFGNLLSAAVGQTLIFGSYTLRPQEYGRGSYTRVYDVFYPHHLDRIGTLSTHPLRGRRSMCAFQVENRLHYTGQAVELLVGLLKAVGATDATLTHWEIQITGPRIIEIPKYIKANNLDRRGGRSWGIEIGDGGSVNGMRVGKQASPRSFNLYRNGPTLERRNRQYIAGRVVADGVATAQDERQLARLELHIRGKEFKRLTYVDRFGELHPLTLQSLLDPAVRLAVFRQQIESGFVFRKEIGKDRYATARFFYWEAIERHYATLHGLSEHNRTTAVREPIKARSSDATYRAKQTIKLLLKDGKPGTYLTTGLQEHIKQAANDASVSDAPRQRLIEKLNNAGCSLPSAIVDEAATAYAAEILGNLAAMTSRSLPGALAQTIASKHGIADYLKKQNRIAVQSQG